MHNEYMAITTEDVKEMTKQGENLVQLLKAASSEKLLTQLQSMPFRDHIILSPKLREKILKMLHQSDGLVVLKTILYLREGS